MLVVVLQQPSARPSRKAALLVGHCPSPHSLALEACSGGLVSAGASVPRCTWSPRGPSLAWSPPGTWCPHLSPAWDSALAAVSLLPDCTDWSRVQLSFLYHHLPSSLGFLCPPGGCATLGAPRSQPPLGSCLQRRNPLPSWYPSFLILGGVCGPRGAFYVCPCGMRAQGRLSSGAWTWPLGFPK